MRLPTGSSAEAPLVSVVIPCYNAQRYVGEAMSSVLEQSLSAIELIVVDDGSTDASVRVAREVAAAHRERVRVCTGPNRGACAARNRGFAASRGRYLQWLDADDYLERTKIEDQLRAAEQNPGAVIYGPWVNQVEVGGMVVASSRHGLRPVDDPLAEQLKGLLVPPHAYLVPREVVIAAGGWNEALTADQDGDFFMRLMLQGVPFKHAAGGAAVWRHHGGNRISALRTEAATRSRYDVCCHVIEELDRGGRLPEYAELMAQRLDSCAQMAARVASELAEQCLARARELYPAYSPPGPLSYRVCRRFLRLAWCEGIRDLRQRLRSATRFRRPTTPAWLSHQRH